jgi:hypothetical protein
MSGEFPEIEINKIQRKKKGKAILAHDPVPSRTGRLQLNSSLDDSEFK